MSVNPNRPANAWRQRGYAAGESGRPKQPPPEQDLRDAYLDGFRRGQTSRRKRESVAADA